MSDTGNDSSVVGRGQGDQGEGRRRREGRIGGLRAEDRGARHGGGSAVDCCSMRDEATIVKTKNLQQNVVRNCEIRLLVKGNFKRPIVCDESDKIRLE